MIHTEDSGSEEDSDRDEEEESNKGEMGGGAPEQTEDYWVKGSAGGSDLLVIFGWCSLLFLGLFLIWIIIYLQDRQWQLEKIYARTGDSCASIWHYGRGIVLVTSTGIVWLCLVAWHIKPVEKTDYEKRTEQRIQEEKKDKENAAEALLQDSTPTAASVCTSPPKLDSPPILLCPVEVEYNDLEEDISSSEDEASNIISSSKNEKINITPMKLLDLGGRLQKYWTVEDDKSTIKFSAKKSSLCKLTDAGFQEVSTFLSSLNHPHIQKIHSVKCIVEGSDTRVVVAQPFWRRGSLRDLIHGKADPMTDWDEKYKSDSGRPLPPNQIRVFGSQLLKAMQYLYKQEFQGKPLYPLEQIQTGNIFIVHDDSCVLGGYENTLLGYRTSLYSSLAHHGLLAYSDIIMFGHVIYEMCTGRTLDVVFPLEKDYDLISDDTCRRAVRYIFKTKHGLLRHDIEQISDMEFFFGEGSIYSQVKQLKDEVSTRARAYSTQAKEKLTEVFNIGRNKKKRSRSISPARNEIQSDDSAYGLSSDKGSTKREKNKSLQKNRSRLAYSRPDFDIKAELTGIREADKTMKSFQKRQKKKQHQRSLTSGKSSQTSGKEHGATAITKRSDSPRLSSLTSTQPSPVMAIHDSSLVVSNTSKDSVLSNVNDDEHMDTYDAKLEMDKEHQQHSKRCCVIFAVSSILIICLLTLVLLAVLRKIDVECLTEVPEESLWDRVNPFRDYLQR